MFKFKSKEIRGSYPRVYDVYIIDGVITDNLHTKLTAYIRRGCNIYAEIILGGDLDCYHTDQTNNKLGIELIHLNTDRIETAKGRGYTGNFAQVVPTLKQYENFFIDVQQPTQDELSYFEMVKGKGGLTLYENHLDQYRCYHLNRK